VPPGFAHGFQTLSEIAIMNYKCRMNYWSLQDEKSILCNDPDINIEWPIKINKISKKDKTAKCLKQIIGLPFYSSN
jgi:dTDP-4-dehydrorhamnose 3,5-epimerase